MLRYPALNPQYFILQWHITERCNWHCRHCYQQEDTDINKELSLENLLKVFRQYLKLIRHFGTLGPDKTRLAITGGEPFLRKDFLLFLEKIYKYNKYFFLSIFSNGSLITTKNAKELKSLGVRVVQVSLEGLEENNDIIRGEGAYQKTMAAIKILLELKMNVTISLTLTKQNVSDIPLLIRLCKELGIHTLGLRRLVPIGRGKQLKDSLLTPLELREFYIYIQKEKEELRKNAGLRFLSCGCEEGLFAQEIKRPLSHCGVIDGRVVVILPNGDVIPCRRLPIKIGNVLNEDLIRIYYTSDKLKQLRNLNNAYDLCRNCIYFDNCLSGAKCISYAYFNKISAPDPQCWRLFKKLPNPNLFKEMEDKLDKRQRVHFQLLPVNKDGR